jgi:2-dehydropantoate 2-reductase
VTPLNILVFGAGAVGSTVGGLLAKSGHRVTLVGRNPHMTRIASSGLQISGLWGDHQITDVKTATEIPAGTFDWILVTTKAYDTESAARALAVRFPKDVPVLHLQNGVGNAEILAQHLGWPRVISGMIIVGFQIPVAGRTIVTVQADKVKIGRKDGTVDSAVEQITKAFHQANIPAEAVSNIQMHLWGKVLYNASLNALAGILGVKYGDLLHPYPWSIIEKVIREAYRVLTLEGQQLFWDSAEGYLDHLKSHQVPDTFDHKPSMLADLHHGRRTEIDYINGALAALGRKHRESTPVNDTLIAMVHALEENGKKGILHPSMQTSEDSSS